jgi:hypothetical protein
LAYTLGFLEFPTWLSPPLSLGLRAVLSRIWPQALLLGLAIAWPARSLLRSGCPGRLEGFRGALSPWAAFSVVLVLAMLLAYGWSMLQFGAAWAFNSFFVFGLLFLALVPLALVLSTRIPRVMPFALAAGVVAMLVAPAPATLFRQSIGDEIHDRVQQLLLTSPPSTPVVVESDDWGLVLPVVLQLERAGVVSLVPPRFGLMAGDARVYPSPAWPSGMRHLTLIVTATPALSLRLGQPTQ